MLKNLTAVSKKGFTLVELLVAVGVVSVASLSLIPSFTTRNKEKALQEAFLKAKDVLGTVQNKAMTEVGSPGAADAVKYKYSGVKFVRNSGNYVVFRSTEASSDVCQNMSSAKSVQDASSALPSSAVAKIASPDNPLCVFFEYKTGNAFTTKGASGVINCTN